MLRVQGSNVRLFNCSLVQLFKVQCFAFKVQMFVYSIVRLFNCSRFNASRSRFKCSRFKKLATKFVEVQGLMVLIKFEKSFFSS
jgi:hypothetical protein